MTALSLQSVFLYAVRSSDDSEALSEDNWNTDILLGVFGLHVKEEQEKPACTLSPNAACLGTELFVDRVLSKMKILALEQSIETAT